MPWEGDRWLAIPSNEVEEGFQPGWQTISHCPSRDFKVFLLFIFSRVTVFDATFGLLSFYLDLERLRVHLQKAQVAQAEDKRNKIVL